MGEGGRRPDEGPTLRMEYGIVGRPNSTDTPLVIPDPILDSGGASLPLCQKLGLTPTMGDSVSQNSSTGLPKGLNHSAQRCRDEGVATLGKARKSHQL
jgi:hypothetical protein